MIARGSGAAREAFAGSKGVTAGDCTRMSYGGWPRHREDQDEQGISSRYRVRSRRGSRAVISGESISDRCRACGGPLTIAVADFDFVDTSGEVKDPRAEHQARVAGFAELVRAKLGAQGDLRVLPLECAEPPCTPVNMRPDNFIAAGRRSGASFVVYGGIHKISTLVQWGDVQLLDLEADKVLFRQNVTFRGDTDEAYRRAAAFVGESVRDAMEKR